MSDREPDSESAPPGRSLRILMVADVDPVHVIGGAERVLNEHATRLAARGHRVVVLTRRAKPELPSDETYRGIRVIRHSWASGAGSAAAMRSVLREGGAAFSQLLKQEQFDLINVHQPLAANAVLRRPESRRLPVLYTYHSPWGEEYRIRQLKHAATSSGARRIVNDLVGWINSRIRCNLERKALSRSQQILVLSEFSRSLLGSIHKIPESRVSVIPGGVDATKFRPSSDRGELRRKLDIPAGQMLLTVRNLEPRMGLGELIKAMASVKATYPECRLYIGGSGSLRSELESQSQALGLQDVVRFVGFIPEQQLPDYYAAADAFVLPTRVLEGFGLVTVEALSCGTPVMGTPIGGTCEILTGFDASFLFSGLDTAAIAELLVRRLPEIYGNQELRSKCREHVLENYDWEVVVPRIESLMRGCIERYSRRGSAAQ